MIPSTKLINALRRTANRIEATPVGDYMPLTDNLDWNWFDNERCNCGLLAQELGFSKEQIDKEILGSWVVQPAICESTGKPLGEILRTLSEFGIEESQIAVLEGPWKRSAEIKYPDVANEPKKTQRLSVEYFRSKANELERQLNCQNSNQSIQQQQTVSV
ncbi:MAG: hypothetical protein ABEJ25_03165 [Candidatus Bipolaricaulia bacterium]